MTITDRQKKYLTMLMSKEFGSNRKVIYKTLFGVSSSSDLTKDQASELIETLAPDSRDESRVSDWKTLVQESLGQTSLF